MEHLKAIGTLFYVIDPKETMYEKVSDIPKPDFTTRVIENSRNNEFLLKITKKYLLGHAIFLFICGD